MIIGDMENIKAVKTIKAIKTKWISKFFFK